MPHDLPRRSLYGRDSAEAGERGVVVQAFGVVPGQDEQRRGMMPTDRRPGDQSRGNLRDQTLQLRVKLGDLLREGLMTAGYRTEREPGRRANVIGITAEAETGTGSDELLGGELA
jgi:hypothetical protein